MNYNIIYDAVEKKAGTNPPNRLIGNTEMAAGIHLVCDELNIQWSNESLEKPSDIKEKFTQLINESTKNNMSDKCKIIVELIDKYAVKEMVNETMNDLKAICLGRMEQTQEWT